MIYDLRIYTPHDGKAEALRRRFIDRVLPIFARLGIEVVQALVPADGEDFWYIARFADAASRDRAWEAFKNDAEWQAVKSRSEADGPLLKSQAVHLFTSALPAPAGA